MKNTIDWLPRSIDLIVVDPCGVEHKMESDSHFLHIRYQICQNKLNGYKVRIKNLDYTIDEDGRIGGNFWDLYDSDMDKHLLALI